MSGDLSDHHHWGQGVCYWHLGGRGYEPSYNIWDSPSQQGIIWPQMSIGLRLRNPGLEAKMHISTVHNSVHSHEAQTRCKERPIHNSPPDLGEEPLRCQHPQKYMHRCRHPRARTRTHTCRHVWTHTHMDTHITVRRPSGSVTARAQGLSVNTELSACVITWCGHHRLGRTARPGSTQFHWVLEQSLYSCSRPGPDLGHGDTETRLSFS